MYFEADDGTKLYYEIHGNNNGRPILFLHGWGVGSVFFSEQIPPLIKAGYKAITMDARSHGKSDRDIKYMEEHKDRMLDLMYMDFMNFLEHLNLKEDFTLIGHSAGGGISLLFGSMTELKEKIASMVIINSGYTISENPSVLLLWELVPLFVNVLYNPLLRTGYKLVLRNNATITALALALQQPREKIRSWIEDLINIPKEQIILEYQNFKRYNIKVHLKDIKCPSLIIGGQLDMVTPVYMSRQMAKEIPNSELVVVNAGHFAMLEQAAQVNQKIIEFLQKNYPANGSSI
ncbi:MAG: alpha/beta fold hydrolase [Candidatus Hodarchaeota archaeon]